MWFGTVIRRINELVCRAGCRRHRNSLLLALTMPAAGACNHVFYHPDFHTRMTPDQVGYRYTEHWIETGAGLKLHAWHILPSGPARGVTVLHMHGNAENISTHFQYSVWLAGLGFDVVVFDYRGYGRSQGEPCRSCTVEDGRRMIGWVRSHPPLASNKLVVFGQSLGGAVAVAAAGTLQDHERQLSALVVEATFNSYRDIARGKLGDIWLTWLFQYPLSYLVSDELSPQDYAPALKVPFLVIHGESDPVVPFRFGERLFAAAPEGRREFWRYQSDGHTMAFVEADSPFRQRLVAWIDAKLSAPGGP